MGDIPTYCLSYQSMINFYLESSAALRCRGCSLPEYFTPKYSNTRVKFMGRLLCVHIPGVVFLGCYLYGARCWNIASCGIRPYCGRTYMPLLTIAKIFPLCTFSLRLYAVVNFYGIIYVCIMMYSTWSICLFRYNYFASIHI